MARPHHRSRAAALLLLAGPLHAPGGQPTVTTLNWASTFTPGANPPIVPQNALGAPDGFVAFFTGSDSAAYSGYAQGDITQRGDLAQLLGVDQAALDNADFIVFECGVTADGGFEQATFVFVGGGNTQVLSSAAATTGVVSLEAYQDFFGVPAAICSGEWAYALFDLTTVDAGAPDLIVQVLAGPGQPAPDAMGVLGELAPPPPPACPADIDASGAVDSTDLNALLADFGCAGECAADIDDDGDTDSADLNELLASFGERCEG